MSGRVWLLLLLVCGLAGMPGLPPAGEATEHDHRPYTEPLTGKDEKWVRQTLAAMTVEEKVGQLVMADANVVFWNRESPEYQRMRHHVIDNKVGGVLLFRSDVWSAAILLDRWQQMAKTPLLTSADLEMGMGMRFNDTPWWAPNMAVAATGDPVWARRHGEATARQARALGINWLYAPSADINNNPANPVINTRSFGEDPAQVSTFVRAFVEGAQDAGALATAKHFPGHGDTATDSHIGLPVVDADIARLRSLELVPFRAAIEARVGSIMSAHISLPQIESTPAAPVRAISEREAAAAEFVSRTESTTNVTLPGTLSPRILTGLLRDEMRFDGLIVTDAMNMAGIAARYTPGEAAVRAVLAGADVVIKPADIDAAVAGLREAVASGAISRQRLDLSVERILRAKARLGLHRRRSVDLNKVDAVINGPDFNDLSRQIAEKSLTLVRDQHRILPLTKESAPPAIFHLTFTDEDDRTITRPFADELISRGASVENHLVDNRTSEREVTAILERLDQSKARLVVYSIPVRARSGKGSITLPPLGKRIADELIARNRPLLIVSFGNPYLLLAFPEAPAYLIAWSPFPVSQRAAARAILGEIPISGKLPISLPGLHPRGHGLAVETASVR